MAELPRLPPSMTTDVGRVHLIAAADNLGRARDLELSAGNTAMGMVLNDCALSLYALAIKVGE